MNCGVVLPGGARFFGYFPDHARNRIVQRPVEDLLRTLSLGVPDNASTEKFWGPICSQGRTGHCGGAGSYQLTYTAAGCVGQQISFYPSQRLTYAVTRALERSVNPDGTADPLTDSGVMPTDLIADLSTFGVAPMYLYQGKPQTPDGRFDDVWGPDDVDPLVSPPNVNDEPDFGKLETAGQKLITGEYRIDETAAGAYDQCAAVLGIPAKGVPSGVPTGVGMFVDSNFMSWTAGMPPIDSIDTSDPQGGDHWLMLGKYERVAATGARVWSLVNSWGLAAGDAGIYRITERGLRQAVSDLLPWTIRQGSLSRNLQAMRSRRAS